MVRPTVLHLAFMTAILAPFTTFAMAQVEDTERPAVGKLTKDEQRWASGRLDVVKAKICCPCGDWSHDCPAARFHQWVK